MTYGEPGVGVCGMITSYTPYRNINDTCIHMHAICLHMHHAEGPVLDRVTVPTHIGRARKDEVLLQPDAKVLEAKVTHVLLQLHDLGLRVHLQI